MGLQRMQGRCKKDSWDAVLGTQTVSWAYETLVALVCACRPSPATAAEEKPATTAPSSFYCPISMELMADPVMVATGHTYDRACIEKWLAQGNRTCPVTGMKLRHLELTPNYALRTAIQVRSTICSRACALSLQIALAQDTSVLEHLQQDARGTVSAGMGHCAWHHAQQQRQPRPTYISLRRRDEEHPAGTACRLYTCMAPQLMAHAAACLHIAQL